MVHQVRHNYCCTFNTMKPQNFLLPPTAMFFEFVKRPDGSEAQLPSDRWLALSVSSFGRCRKL